MVKCFGVELAGSSGIRLRREGGCAIVSGLCTYRLAAQEKEDLPKQRSIGELCGDEMVDGIY